MVIQHNMGAAFTQRQLSITGKDKAKRMEKLSSGFRINRASDDAAGLTISEEMRGQIRGLSSAANNIQDGVSLIQTAEGGMNEIHAILQRQRELIVQAANDTNTESDRDKIQEEIDQLSAEADRIANHTEFNTIKLLCNDTPDSYVIPPEDINRQTVATNVYTSTQDQPRKVVFRASNGAIPDDTSVTTKYREHSSKTYQEKEKVVGTDPKTGETIIDYINVVNQSDSDTLTERTVTKHYTEMSAAEKEKYTALMPPEQTIRNNGYLSFQNQNRTLPLSCAMTVLGLKVNGEVVSNNIYSDVNRAGSKITNTSQKGTNQVTNVYTYKDDAKGIHVELKQDIVLDTASNLYRFNFSIENKSLSTAEVDFRLAFDAMNADYGSPESSVINDPAKTYTIHNKQATISVKHESGQNPTSSAFADISDIYVGVWGTDHLRQDTFTHTGVGYWWNGQSITSGATWNSTVTYGPIEFYAYYEDTTITTKKTVTTTTTKTGLAYTAVPKQLMIQKGANEYQGLGIRLFNLTAPALHLDDVNVANCHQSFYTLDWAIDRVSGIRSEYGAYQNRLEHSFANVNNMAENLQSAESRIRDADMAEEMVGFSKDSILEQAAQAILTQSSHSLERVLELLQ